MENPIELIPDIPMQLSADQPFLWGKHIMILSFTWPSGIKEPNSTRMHSPSIEETAKK
jgi:hypothetical protein